MYLTNLEDHVDFFVDYLGYILQPQCLIILFFATGVFSKISKHVKAENKRAHALICKPIANKKLSYR